MKPLGMDPFFRIVKPSKAEDLIHDAVQQARIEKMEVREFIANAMESWKIIQDDQIEYDASEFRKALE